MSRRSKLPEGGSNGCYVLDHALTRRVSTIPTATGSRIRARLDLDFGEVGVYDPGDILYTRITITNTGDQAATGVTISRQFRRLDVRRRRQRVSGTPFLNISPIARNDTFEAVGNTVLRVGTANTINGGNSTFFAGNLTTQRRRPASPATAFPGSSSTP